MTLELLGRPAVMSEPELLRAYGEDSSVLALGPVEERRCACSGWVVADPYRPTSGVMEHNESGLHLAWRKRSAG